MLRPFPDWLGSELPFTRHRVPVGDGLHMHVMTVGQGTPVLLQHGNPTWGYLWRKVATALDDAPLRLVMPDLIGLGCSDRVPAADHTLDNHIRWLGAAIDHLGLDRLTLGVQDWGGAIGVGAMAQRAARLHGLVVLNTVLGPPKPGFKSTVFHRFAHTPLLSDLAFRALEFPQRRLSIAQGDKSSIGPEQTRAYRWALSEERIAPLALARMVPDTLDHPSIAPLGRVQDFVQAWTGPAAIVWGDQDPVLGRLRRRISRWLPHAPVTVTQAGHFLQEEVPAEIAAAIQRVAHTEAADERG